MEKVLLFVSVIPKESYLISATIEYLLFTDKIPDYIRDYTEALEFLSKRIGYDNYSHLSTEYEIEMTDYTDESASMMIDRAAHITEALEDAIRGERHIIIPLR